ncbi:Protein of unknown function [Rhodoblastus acidophilus]|uniref:DUF3108 domain-containing protein n=1 Tax=Rhodoblastus acidophilus TaxID=1074 RepID=A0A212RKR9_RHOAC|nr:DUF3108 domain-containing protein [Rhodoblastus acidophilus]MCW2315882.1 hypothetical protein [Rhodoblastus acidophilus]SNB73068.1 Protein of unknown function [Rhodoblastus acidophilus]
MSLVRQPFQSLSLGLSLGLTLWAGVARAENVHAHYRVSLIGLPIGVADASSVLDDKRYRVDLNVKLTGVASLVSNLKMALASTGQFEGGAPAPMTYATTASNSRETRTLRMALASGTVRQVQYSPFWEEDKTPDHVPLTDAHRRDILDPLSAFLLPAPGNPVGPGACRSRVPVYDGYTRFDVTLSYVGVKEIKEKGYSGPVTVCKARYIPIAGHKTTAKGTQFMAQNDQMDVWLAPIGRAHVAIPYRVSLMTQVGTIVVEASELRVGP